LAEGKDQITIFRSVFTHFGQVTAKTRPPRGREIRSATPEQEAGKEVTLRSDIYPLGSVLGLHSSGKSDVAFNSSIVVRYR
jgi:hypothetical protein